MPDSRNLIELNSIQKEFLNALNIPFDGYQDMATDLQVLFESSFDVLFVSDANGKALRVSSACEHFWGKKREEFIGQNIFDLEKQKVFSPSITAMVLKERRKVSTIQKTSTGKTLLVVGTPVKDAEGNIIRVVNASRDITEVTRLQEELKEIREIAELYQKKLEEIEKTFSTSKKLIYASALMGDLADQVKRVAKYNSSILITGESGVGKEIIASMIHEWSNRANQPFIKINCSAIPENLLESELFGYERGAFTGAEKGGKDGLFLAANNGTILLDEISELPLTLQAKLLRVLQESELRKVGSVKSIPINVRIIASTNRSIEALIKEGKFREDLYYRLNVIPLKVPALRERKEDIPLLIEHFTRQFNKEYSSKKSFSDCAKREVLKYPWKGNVRELRNFVERLFIVSSQDQISAQEITHLLGNSDKIPIHIHFGDKIDLYQTLENIERQILEYASAAHNTTTAIAEALNVNQSTVSKKLKKYQIHLKKHQ